MSFNTALCFPETRAEPFSRRFLPLFFDNLLYFTPANPTSESTGSAEDQVLLSFRNPFSDEPDSSRFDRLAAELAGRGREYYRHFLAARPPAGGGTAEEASVASLVSLLAGQKPEMDSMESRQRERHWQARLVLLLSTLLAEEETTVAQCLQEIAARKREMLTALQGIDEENPVDCGKTWLPSRPFYPDYSPPQLKNLLQAFATFYLIDDAVQDALPCTAHSAGANLLFELYEKKSRQPAIELASLQLPAILPADNDEGQAQFLTFRQQTGITRQNLCELLQKCATEKAVAEKLLPQIRQEATCFNTISETAAKSKGARLTVHLLPAMPLPALLGFAFPQAAPHAPVAADGSNGLLALLSPL